MWFKINLRRVDEKIVNLIYFSCNTLLTVEVNVSHKSP
jgi:hypothetical protein